jgi:hypothetical protein
MMTAPAGTYNITADQGATFTRQLTWKDSAGSAVNLTGYTARMQLRQSIDASGAAVLSLTTENNRIVLGGTAGTIDLSVTATTMETVSPYTYVYDLELITGSVVTRLVQGTFEVRGEVTR